MRTRPSFAPRSTWRATSAWRSLPRASRPRRTGSSWPPWAATPLRATISAARCPLTSSRTGYVAATPRLPARRTRSRSDLAGSHASCARPCRYLAAPMKVHLPDGTQLELDDGASGADAARAIGEGLARAALGGRGDGELRDLAAPLQDGDRIEIVTSRDDDGLWLLRHDAAHVLATAVMELYPGVKISIGPPIEDGFYYDFDFPDGTKLTEDDFERIEAKMREHVKADESFEREDVPVAQAIERFKGEGQDYKVELIEDLVSEQGVDTVSLYRNGPFTDLCRGPHGPGTKRIKAFKLTSVAGAYW